MPTGYAIDFKSLKQQIDLEDAINYLGLTLKRNGRQWRGKCPACNTGDDRALVITDGRGAYCHALGRGGDQVFLVSHIQNISMREAAERLVEHYEIDASTPLPQERAPVTATRPQEPAQPAPQARKETATTPTDAAGSTALAPLAYLQYEHEAVQALGLTPDTAEALGLGYAAKGQDRRSALPRRRAGRVRRDHARRRYKAAVQFVRAGTARIAHQTKVHIQRLCFFL